MDNAPILSVLEILVGKQLGSVTFTEDYWQLGFDGSQLTVFSGMMVAVAGRRVRNGEDQFRDCLCERISGTVTHVSIGDDQLLLTFGDGALLAVDMIASTGEQALQFQAKDDADVWIA